MVHYKLTAPQIAATGYTDLFRLRPVDGDLVQKATTVTTLTKLGIGDVVYRTYMEVQTPVDTVGLATISVGVTDTVDLFIFLISIKAANRRSALLSLTPHPCVAAENVVASFIVSDDPITKGEVWVWMEIRRANERPTVGDL